MSDLHDQFFRTLTKYKFTVGKGLKLDHLIKELCEVAVGYQDEIPEGELFREISRQYYAAARGRGYFKRDIAHSDRYNHSFFSFAHWLDRHYDIKVAWKRTRRERLKIWWNKKRYDFKKFFKTKWIKTQGK